MRGILGTCTLPARHAGCPPPRRDIKEAIDHELIEETHYLDAKREIAAGKGANKETARDLAQFALDGGTLLVGVEEDKTTRRFGRYPVPLSGLPERIETIARDLCDPPLFVRTRAIPSEGDPAEGYVVVEVPPSPDAPHMVDGCYYGRGDKRRNRLSDPDVERLILARQRQAEVFANDLATFVASDPWPAAIQQRGHLFLLAQPVRPRPGMAMAYTHEKDWQPRFHGLVRTAYDDSAAREALRPHGLKYGGDGWSPDLDDLTQVARRPGGAALTVPALIQWPVLAQHADEGGLLDLQLDENGELKLYCGRATDEVASRRFPATGNEPPALWEMLVIGLSRRVITLARILSDQAGYGGPWNLGLELTGIGGSVSYRMQLSLSTHGSNTPYADSSYRSMTTAVTAELEEAPEQVTERLLGRLLRSLGSANAFKGLLER